MFRRRVLAGMIAGAMGLGMFAVAESADSAPQALMAPQVVYQLETRLDALGYLSKGVDQTYDEDTRAALEALQQANGLPVTGQPDEATVALLESGAALTRQDYLRRFIQGYQDMTPLRPGDIRNQVQTMQQKLLEYGYYSGTPDGVFSDATRAAVERFQMVNGLTVTGEADGMTLMRLMADVPITWQGFLNEMACAAGDAGLNVYVLQKKLMEMGDFEGDCTGSFGELTQRAVMQLQQDNGLEVTGAADPALWELIYSGTAVARRRADVLQLGDSGEGVTQVQQRLNALGYLTREADGSFDRVTVTAVRLFQMANELTVTGRVGGDTLNALLSDKARAIGDAAVQERYSALLSARSRASQERMSEIAAQLVGTQFQAADEALYPGFALVQYVCVAAGLPVTNPETLIRLAEDPVESAEEAEAGNVLAFQMSGTDSVTMLMTVAAGEGRIIYTTKDIGWVVMSYINQIDSESVYRWAETAA